MNGAELLVKTAVGVGVEVCFANPGTTELPIVTALDTMPGIKAFLGLFEGVCTGAADGYGRMLDKPAMVLLHLGPGFANAIANLHNARRAKSSVLNVVGEHASWHQDADPPLAMDIESLARTVSGWWRTNKSALDVGIVDESITTGSLYFSPPTGLPAHSLMTLAGGSIGQGIPCATGAAIACPDRPVIDLQADGSAMYTVQALWTQARERLNVTTLICSNRSYRILQVELSRAGIMSYGPNTQALTELIKPPIDWVKIAQGFGVPGVVVSTAEDLARELSKALTEPGPHLIEMLLP